MGKKRRRKKRLAKININNFERTPEEIINAFPKGLVDAFIATAIDDWKSQKIYGKYCEQAKKYLGRKYNDSIDSGRLVVLLSKATRDIIEEKQKNLKNRCKDHPKYKAMRKPRLDCKKCWALYNGKKKKGKKKTKKGS